MKRKRYPATLQEYTGMKPQQPTRVFQLTRNHQGMPSKTLTMYNLEGNLIIDITASLAGYNHNIMLTTEEIKQVIGRLQTIIKESE